MAKLIKARALTAFIIQSDTIPNVVSVEWADDGKTLFYTVPDHLKRPYKVRARTSLAGPKTEFLGLRR
jgi:protease II